MSIFDVQLKGRRVIAHDTMAFYFTKPDGFTFQAGQTADFTLLDPPENDAEGAIRTFSFAGAPYEEDLMVATRMRDTAFKRVLKTIPLGSPLKMDAPYGSLTLHRNPAIPAVFLTGGIGITPVRSIILQANHDHLGHGITLFNSNRRPEDASFLEEFADAQKENPHFICVNTMTQMEKSSEKWSGETGYFTQAMLAKTITDFSRPIYYLSGPQAMVASIRRTLDECGVADDQIRTEEFSGY